MDIFTQCIYDWQASADVLGLSVMSRHTQSNGWSEDPRIKDTSYTWVPDLAPPDKLVGAWYRSQCTGHPMAEEEFTAHYLDYLSQHPQRVTLDVLLELIGNTQRKPVLLCVEPKNAFCHRRVLAELCQQLAPGLTIIHL